MTETSVLFAARSRPKFDPVIRGYSREIEKNNTTEGSSKEALYLILAYFVVMGTRKNSVSLVGSVPAT